MAFDQHLAARIRQVIGVRRGLSERKMFGALVFLLDGNMCCGVVASRLVVRLEPAEAEAALAEPGARTFDVSGRPMQGWVLVDVDAVKDHTSLAAWVHRAVEYTVSLSAG